MVNIRYSKNSQIGVWGDNAHIEGDIHIHGQPMGAPLLLPRRPDHFTGRCQEMEDIMAVLGPGSVVALWGPGGIGKSAIAAETLYRITADGTKPPAQFPDGVIWHEFYSAPEVHRALEQIARSFGQPPDPTPREAALRALSGKKALILLDGAENADDLSAVLDVAGRCAVIVTTRKKEEASTFIEVGPLPADDAANLIGAFAGEMVDEPNAVHRICELIGNFPLALQLAGAYMSKKSESASEYLKWMKKTPLDALHHGERVRKSVNVLLKRSLEQLGEQSRKILSVCGVLAFAPFRREVVAAALEVEPEKLRRSLDELTEYALVRKKDDRYTLIHVLIYAYVRENHPPRIEDVDRMRAFYDAFVEEQEKKGPAGYAVLRPEKLHVLSLLEVYAGEHPYLSNDREGQDPASQIINELFVSFTKKIAHELHIQSEDRFHEEVVFLEKGTYYLSLGQHEEALQYYERALGISREIGDRKGEMVILGNLGRTYHDLLGLSEKAIEYHEEALDIARDISDRYYEKIALGDIGNSYLTIGQTEKAIQFMEQALAIARETRDLIEEGSILHKIGVAHQSLGQTKEAIEYHKKVLTIAGEFNDWCESDNAIQFMEQALAVSRAIGNRESEGIVLGKLGRVYYNLGLSEKAIEHHEQALAISRKIGNQDDLKTALGDMGETYLALGQTEKAIQFMEQALAIGGDIKGQIEEGRTLYKIGAAHQSLGQTKEAIEYHKKVLTIAGEFNDWSENDKTIQFMEQALAISREIGNRESEGVVLGKLGRVYHNLGLSEKAIEYHEHALVIAKEFDNCIEEGRILYDLGTAYYSLGQTGSAIECYDQALAIKRKIGNRDDEGGILYRLGVAYYSLCQTEKAIHLMEQALTIVRKSFFYSCSCWLKSLQKRIGLSASTNGISQISGTPARKPDDCGEEGRILYKLGIAYNDIGQNKKAIASMEQALAIARKSGNQHEETKVIDKLGFAYLSSGRIKKGTDLMTQALAIESGLDNWGEDGKAQKELETVCSSLSLSQTESDIILYEQMLSIARDSGDQFGDRGEEGRIIYKLGGSYSSLGQTEKAIKCYEQALAIARKVGAQSNEGFGEESCLGKLGVAQSALGHYQEAIKYFEKALAIAREHRDQKGEEQWLGGLGNSHYSLGETEKAIEYYEQALSIARKGSGLGADSAWLHGLGKANLSQMQHQKAIEYFEQALAIDRNFGNHSSEMVCLKSIGFSHNSLGHFRKGIEYYEQAHSIAIKIGDRHCEIGCLCGIGEAHKSIGQFQKAIKCYEKAIDISREIGDRRSEMDSLDDIGEAHSSLEHYQKAIEYYEQALDISREIGNRQKEGNLFGNLGDAYKNLDQVETARTMMKQALAIFEDIQSPYAELARKWLAQLDEDGAE